MRIAIVALVCAFCTFAAAETLEEFGYDWDNIKPAILVKEPVGPIPDITDIGSRIIGGTVAARGAFPYQAALIINGNSFCGGSIISSQWVLTAAHCVDTATGVQVILGAHNPTTTINEPTQVRLAADGRVVHAEWNRDTLQFDIALLRTAAIPVGSSGISAIALAPASSGTFAGSTAVLTGWGRTSDLSTSIADELRTVELQILTNAVCQNSYGSTIAAQHICTSGAGRVGACNGDSGGPLVVNGVEVGVVSFGSILCSVGLPSAYARVSFFRAWITANSGV